MDPSVESDTRFLLCWGPERAFEVVLVWSSRFSISKVDDLCLEAGPVLLCSARGLGIEGAGPRVRSQGLGLWTI